MHKRKSIPDLIKPGPLTSLFLALAFSIVIYFFDSRAAAQTGLTLAMIALFPRFRLELISLSSLLAFVFFGYNSQFMDPRDQFLAEMGHQWQIPFALAFGILILAFCQKLFQQKLAPVLLTVIAIYFLGVIIAPITSPILKTFIAGTLVSITKLFWYLFYDLSKTQSDGVSQIKRPWIQSFAYYRPFWSHFYYAPIPKGESFWNAHDTKSEQSLHQLRFKSLALLAWGTFLFKIFKLSRDQIVVTAENMNPYFRIPTLSQYVGAIDAGIHPQTILAWQTVTIDFLLNLLLFTAISHIIIATVWFCGFQVPLNTNFPLMAKNPLDFFNRYNRYFKDLLFEAFFFPTFAKLKGLPNTARLLVATFLSVGLGNFLIIFGRNTDLHLNHGLWNSLIHFSHYLIYTLLLSTLVFPWIYLSFKKTTQQINRIFQYTLTFLSIMAFAAIRIFDEPITGTLTAKIKLFLTLFGATL